LTGSAPREHGPTPSDKGTADVDGLTGLPPRQRWLAMIPVGVAVALASLDAAIANTALPTIAADLHAGAADSIWVVNAYQLALVVSLLPLASLGEILGYRRIYIAGLIVFTVASLACALAWSLPSLTIARAFQGLGAAGIMSVNSALVRFIYPTRQLGRGIGNVALIVAISAAAGPTVASAILSFAAWPWLFAVNVPFGILSVAIAFASLPRTRLLSHRFDVVSAILNAATFSLLIIGIGEAAHAASPVEVGAELLGFIVFGFLLVRRQISHPAPMLPIDLFKRPIFALSAATSSCSFACQAAAYVSLPFFFQHILGRTQVETGYLMTPWPVTVAILAPIASRMSDRYPAAILGGVGMVLLSLGMISLVFMPASPSVIDIAWRMVLCGAGFGFFQTPNLRAMMNASPPERAGGASGVVATSRLLGQAIGAAMVALCLGLFPAKGSMVALGVGAAFAICASVASFSRLFATQPSASYDK
jgi:DHA2 family multidrug resistance protein-like MFS transporter